MYRKLRPNNLSDHRICSGLLLILVYFMIFAQVAEATLVKEFFPMGLVDWSSGAIQIKARSRGLSGKAGVKQSYQAALDEAFADFFMKAKETLTGLRVNQNTLAGEVVAESDVLVFEIERIIKQTQLIKLQYNLDGTVTIEGNLPLYGARGIGTVLLSNKLGSSIVEETPEVIPFLHIADKAAISDDGAIYTGLIIDASMYELNPALLPVIYDQDRKVIYGGNQGSCIDEVKAKGLVNYVSSLQEAKALTGRVGSNPLIVRAAGVDGSFKTDLILFQSDIKKIELIIKEYNFLKIAGVAIVLKR